MIKTHIARQILGVTIATLVTANGLADESRPHHHQLARDVDAFHSVLAPVWHARPGAGRLQNACANVQDMARLAGDIRSTDASQLIASVASLKTACLAKQGDVDGAFYDVHEAFHRLIDAKPMATKR